MKKLLIVLLALNLIPLKGFTQNEEMPEQEFEEPTFPGGQVPPPPPPPALENQTPPPPPPPPDSGSFGGVHGATGSDAGKRKNKLSIAEAQPEDITDENFPDLIESFDYPNADIKDVIKAISELTHKNFIIDNNVQGHITIIAPTRITVAEAWKAFLSALAINGLTVVPSGKFLKIKQARDAQKDAIETYSGAYYPTSEVMITRIVQLKHISAEEVSKILRPLLTKQGDLNPYTQTNSLIISDFGSNIERIARILLELDKPGFEERMEVIRVRYAKARDIADIITQVINKESTGGKGVSRFTPRIPRFGQPQGKTGAEELSMVTPDERTNSIIVLGNEAGIEKVKQLVKQLDFRLNPEDAGGVFVYYVKYGEAEKIAGVLNGIAADVKAKQGQGQPGIPAPAPFPVQNPFAPPGEEGAAVFGGDVKVAFDKLTNSLIITASKQDYEVVKNILSKIDIPRDQAFVEAIIMEMSSHKKNIWGINYYKFADDGAGNAIPSGRMGFADGTLGDFLFNPTNDKGAILGFGQGQKLTLTIPGQSVPIQINSLVGFIKFLTTNTEANVLSNPRILAMNNEESEIEVGDKVPVGFTTSVPGPGQNPVQSPQFENATIKLTVTPFISPTDKTIRMKVKQIVTQLATQTSTAQNLATNPQSLSTRSITTNIVVPSGDTAVLGGLIRNEDDVTISKVPILGDIPILGWLFKSQTVDHDRKNLVVFITPKIVRGGSETSHAILDRTINERIDYVKENNRGIDPFGKKIDNLPRVATPAGSKSNTEDVIEDTLKTE